LILHFYFESFYDKKDFKIYQVISSLIGHESKGSIYYYLKNEGLIDSLSSSGNDRFYQFGEF
jgi:secreted Zn-dependent insulinase-like peptidase